MPTPSELKEIKQMLISGEKEEILKAVDKIKIFLYQEKCLPDLISSDISEFLCDALMPFESITCSAVFGCLECLMQHETFFGQNHSFLVVESLVRSMHFLTKNPCTSSNLSQCLNLLVIITQGHSTFNVTPDLKTVENIVQALPDLLKNISLTVNNKYQIGCIILNLLILNGLTVNQDAFENMLKCFSTWMDVIKEFLHFDHPARQNLVFLSCLICNSALKSIVSRDYPGNKTFSDTYDQLKEGIVSKVGNFIIDVATPFLDGLPVETIEKETNIVECFFQISLYFLRDGVSSQKNSIAHGLCEMGFLQFVTKIISFADFSDGEYLRKLGVLVLSHAVLALAEDVFQIPVLWPCGRDDFHGEIQKGFSRLPLDASQWLDVLINPDSLNLCKIALLIYLYFYCMTAKSQLILETIYPSIVTFINISTSIEFPALLLKIVWFILVMSQLSCEEINRPENETEATDKLVSILEEYQDLGLVYTHHPALLYWAFSSELNSSIQTKIVHLWLRNRSPDCKELEDLIENSSEVRFAILNERGQVLDSAFSMLNSILSESENDNLPSNIWFLLPQILAKYTTDAASAKNVDYVIELCSLKAPRNVDITKMIRVASLLPEVLKSDLISVVPSYTLTYKLLKLGVELNDLRVMQVFLRFDGFIQKILEGIESNVCEIALITLKIVTLLWQTGPRSSKLERCKKIKLSKETIIKILERNFTETLIAAVDLVQEILISGFRSSIFHIEEVDDGFIEILFFEIENLCLKGFPEICARCWLCLKSFLLLDEREPKFDVSELAADPFLHELIGFHLSDLLHSQEMKDFLDLWLDRNNSIIGDRCFEARIFGELFAESIHSIALYIKENFREDIRNLYEKVLKFESSD